MLQTLDDGQEDNDHKEEEGDVKQDTIDLIRVSIRRLYLITNSSTSSHSHVQMVDIALFTTQKTSAAIIKEWPQSKLIIYVKNTFSQSVSAKTGITH